MAGVGEVGDSAVGLRVGGVGGGGAKDLTQLMPEQTSHHWFHELQKRIFDYSKYQ